MAKSFKSYNPVNNKVLGTYPIQLDKEIDQVVARARVVSSKWVNLGFNGRKKTLLAWSNYIIKNIEEIASVVSLEAPQ